MLKRKKLIISSIAITITLSTFTSFAVTNKKKTTEETLNKTALASQMVKDQEPGTYDNIEDTASSSISKPVDTVENAAKIITYTAKSGDTLESISSVYKVKVNTIAESNNLSADASLKEGQVLEFPSTDGVLYKIKDGETLWDLASLNNVDINKIIELNQLESPEKLKLGQKIIIPNVDKVKTVDLNLSTSDKTIVASNTATNETTKAQAKPKVVSRGGTISNIAGILPVNGTISSRFGMRSGKLHTGIDIAAPIGTDVFAFMDGIVSFSGYRGNYGNLVIIDHGNGLQSYYAHNSKLSVKQGQRVSLGTKIADVGVTGNTTGPHSHFEIRKNGTAVNPFNYIK